MNNKKLGVNYILNLTYQIIAIIIPLITAPYLSRVLGANGVGQYSFTFSIANYFSLIAALGFNTYAQREIAKANGDKKKISTTFSEVLIVKLVTTVIALGINFYLVANSFYGKYTELMLWWSLLIISTGMDINFLFQGMEEFGKIIRKNILVKIIALLLIFTIVKSVNDVWIYIAIYSGSILLGNISMWDYIPRYIQKVQLHELYPQKHIIPAFKLFVPTIATSIYAFLDKTMIGLLASNADYENGCYEQAEKIVKMATTVIVSLGTVMIPRNSVLFASEKYDELRKNIYFASNYVWFLGVPIMFGIMAVANNLIPWFLGDGFEKSIIIMELLAPLPIFMGFGDVFGLQYLVPAKRDNQWTLCIVIGLILNVIVNVLMIPRFYSLGAVVGTLVAEGTICIMMGYCSRNFVSLHTIFASSVKFLLSGLIMFVIVYFTQKSLHPSPINTLILMIEGVFVYLVFLIILKEKFIKNMINYVILRIRKHE